MVAKMGIIYGLLDESTLEVRYIGKTKNSPARRFAAHVASQVNPHLRAWLAKTHKPNLILFDEVPDHLLSESEIKWIADFRRSGARLVNITNGGEGCFTRRGSPWNKGEHTGQVPWNKGRTGIYTSEHRALLSDLLRARRTGTRASAETKAKMSATRTGKKHSWGDKISEGRRRHISMHDFECKCVRRDKGGNKSDGKTSNAAQDHMYRPF